MAKPKRTAAEQAQRDRQIPRPPHDLGLRVVGQNDWLAVWDRVIARPPVKLVGYALARFADWEDGADVHPGNDLLMLRTGIKSDKTIRSALAQIRDSWGLVWRSHEGYKFGRQGHSDVYRLTIPDDILDGRVPLLTPEGRVPGTPVLRTGVPRTPVHSSRTPVIDDPEPRYPLPATSTGTQTDTQTDIEVHASNGSVEAARAAARESSPELRSGDPGSGAHREGVPARPGQVTSAPGAQADWVHTPNPRSQDCQAGLHTRCAYGPSETDPKERWCTCGCHKRRAAPRARQGAGAAR
jgi:hypothetical protein